MQELRVRRSWMSWGPGSFVRYELFWNGEVMLVKRICTRLEGPIRRETDQVVAVSAIAVTKDDEAIGLGAAWRREAWAVEANS